MMSEQSELDELIRVLGQRLAKIRRETGLMQAQLAARLRGTNRGRENLNLCNLRNLWIAPGPGETPPSGVRNAPQERAG
jgi:hypothetical protein